MAYGPGLPKPGGYRVSTFAKPKPMRPMGTLAGRQGAAYGGAGFTPLTQTPAAAPAARVAPQPVSPWMTDAQLEAQAKRLAMDQIQPLIDAINASISQRAASGQKAITDLTGMLATQFGNYGPAVGAAYGTAQKAVAGTEDALANRLSGQGSQVGGTLSAALAAAGQDTAPGANLVSVGQNAGNASLAKGSASLDALIAQAAAAKDYGAKLPGIAAMTGAQNSRDFQAQLNNELATSLQGLKGQVPGVAASILNSLYSRQASQKALAANAKSTADARAQRQQEFATQTQQNQAALTEKQREYNLFYQLSTGKAVAGLGQQQATLNARVSHDKAIEANQRASIQQRAQASKDRLQAQTQKAKLAAQQGSAKSRQAAIVKANGVAVSLAKGSTARQGVYKMTPKTDQFGNVVKGPDKKPVMVRAQVGSTRSASYYQTIHRVEAAVEPILSPYLGQADIVRFAQKIVNQYYTTPGQEGRPGTIPSDTQRAKKQPSAKTSVVFTNPRPRSKPKPVTGMPQVKDPRFP